nr:IS66 family insertion sequence element accessory protein TnpB [Neobacillus mesonae]
MCGKTDMRKGIDGLATLIQESFELDPYGDSIFLFSGWSKDRYKCLYFDGDGFAMLYKRLDNGKHQWPKYKNEVRNLSQKELRWLLEGAPSSISRHQKVPSKFVKALHLVFIPLFELVIIKRVNPNEKW